ncbi:MAG: amidohydrolase family protein [Eubacteriaceae bacterium]|nr:amidohydrolase family protein [Eubacteriaceae bacterium]
MKAELHAHVIMDAINYKQAMARHEKGVDKAYVRGVLETYQRAGITLIRDGGDFAGVGEYAKEIAPEYGITYLTPIFALHREGYYGSVVGFGYRTMEEYRNYVADIKRRGGNFVKIMTTGILDFARYGVISEGALSLGEIKELVNIAHGEGFAVMSHTNGAVNVKNAVEGGVDSIEHGSYMDEDAVDYLAQSGTLWVPTIATQKNLLRTERYPAEIVSKIVAVNEENIAAAIRKGANVGVGSDAGAYAVFHAEGTLDEYAYIRALSDSEERFETLCTRSINTIKEKFMK